MEEHIENYIVTEVGCFGSMNEFKESDPTCEQLLPSGRKKKKVSVDDLITEAIKTNKTNLMG